MTEQTKKADSLKVWTGEFRASFVALFERTSHRVYGYVRRHCEDADCDDVVAEVAAHLAGRVAELEARGVARERIVLDPGIGFGKRVEDNFALIRGQQALLALGLPVLAGWFY